MKKFKGLLITLLTFLLVSCNPIVGQKNGNDTGEDSTKTEIVVIFGTPRQYLGESFEAYKSQIDSLCQADTLPNIDDWLTVKFKDDETGVDYFKKMCIKYFKNTETVYTIIIDEAEPYPYTKRITER